MRPAGPASWGFYLFLRLGLVLARVLPPLWLIAAGARLGAWWSHLAPSRRAVAENLRLIAQERSRTGTAGRPPQVASVFASYGRYWAEFLVLAVRPRYLDRLSISAEGVEHLAGGAARGPVCILTGHLGNWDLGARWSAQRLGNLAVVVEQLRPAPLYRLFRRLREEGGCKVISATQGGVALSRHLRDGGHLAMVADRPFGTGTEAVSLLGRSHLLPAAGMRLARQAGASLLPAFLWREGNGFVVRFYPPLGPVEDPAPAFARILEGEILAHPEQWCVLQSLEAE